MAGKPDPLIPWDRIRRMYESDAMSNRALGRLFRVTEGAIRRRAKREGWRRLPLWIWRQKYLKKG